MVDLNITLPDKFLKGEFRNGHFVKASIKQLWAVELDLMVQFSGVCAEHNLTWFIDGGSLLGAVRHSGYIPWDDDIDIIMPREDYNRFLEVAHFEEPYFLQNFKTEGRSLQRFSKLRNSNTTMITNLRPLNNIITNEGIFIDIFPVDMVPEDKQERIEFYNELKPIMLEAKRARMRAIEHCLTDEHDEEIRGIMQEYEDVMTSYSGETGLMANIPLSIAHNAKKEWLYHIEDYAETIMLPFEFLQVPAPKGYERMLQEHYGKNWETPIKGEGEHRTYLFDTNKSYRNQ